MCYSVALDHVCLYIVLNLWTVFDNTLLDAVYEVCLQFVLKLCMMFVCSLRCSDVVYDVCECVIL